MRGPHGPPLRVDWELRRTAQYEAISSLPSLRHDHLPLLFRALLHRIHALRSAGQLQPLQV